MRTSYMRRYTSLPYLIDVLFNKRLILLDPKNLEDQHDSYFIELYKNASGYKSVLALCFTEANETYHHWKIYSPDASGVCIEFKKKELIGFFDLVDGVRYEKVAYKRVRDIVKTDKPKLEKLPFIKRFVFKDEKEYRFIYEGFSNDENIKGVPIELNCIARIILSPWMPKSVFHSVAKAIRLIDGCAEIAVARTSLVNHDLWKSVASNQYS